MKIRRMLMMIMMMMIINTMIKMVRMKILDDACDDHHQNE